MLVKRHVKKYPHICDNVFIINPYGKERGMSLPVLGLPLALGRADAAPSRASTSKAYACFSSRSNSTRVKISPVRSLK